MKRKILMTFLLVTAFSLAVSGCQSLTGEESTQLTASGTISVTQVEIAPQMSGMVVSVTANEGDSVMKGDELFRQDDSLLTAQRDQADAAVTLAEKALASAKIQYDIMLTTAKMQDQQNRVNSWTLTQPNQFELPIWYFDKSEKISSASAEMDAASIDLENEKENLQKILNNYSSQEFLKAEKRLADAQAAFLIAEQVRTQANGAKAKEDLYDYAEELYSAAEDELTSAQTNYDRLLTTQQAADIREARARVRVAQERYDRAVDYYNSLLSGDQSLQVQAAAAGVDQAEAALKQAQAARALIDVQLSKTVVTSPTDGIVLARSVEEGEMAAAGGTVLTIGHLEEVNLIVYIPETEYGKVKIGDEVSISVDSFPGKTYKGTVTYISDQAEFTPRNVQTVEGRRTTVYAVKITVPNPDLELKPGMPADVTFGEK
jgi:multidrug resistance efflux pump